ncbi:hypothetical protein [Yinghuangia seranimata]|uniref:hypothetical protein n=1 Tax=Yinghuangia seranimata TaxID=408067 RepID=UPI00248C8C4F|nr:hypothetical protein [Yinghuangia seranimata]MDI2132338.1 hypothetical protein [Yinghuangia seranimata]
MRSRPLSDSIRPAARSARRSRAFAAVAACALVLTGPAATASADTGAGSDPGDGGELAAAEAASTPSCDPIDPTACLLPFPNDWYTVRDRSTETGRRVAFTSAMLPTNALGASVDPAAWNRSDGFSPGSMLVVHVPGLDLARSGAAPVTDVARSLAPDAPIVIVDTETGRRWPYWAELDATATDPARQALLVHPARSFTPGHTYAVGLRGLRDTAGAPIAAGPVFSRLVGGNLPRTDPLWARQKRLRPALRELADHAHVDVRGLYLAWDFTVASTENLTGALLHMRDDAFRDLRGKAPSYTITSVTDRTPDQDPRIAREVRGVVTVPSYLNQPDGPPGSSFNYGRDGLPRQLPGNTQQAAFQCEIPRSAFDAPSQASLYGHGLLGSEREVAAGNVKAMAQEHDFTFCAAKWIGMSEDDIQVVAGSLTNIANFPAVADRLQQGVLDTLFLGRLLAHPKGLSADPAFRTPDGRPLVDQRKGVVYDGNSQGGIMGGTVVAVSQDVRRAVLGVPGMNYSLLLSRSTDFVPFGQLMNQSYPDKLDQETVFSLLQMLWDRAEPDGYAANMTDHPLPETPRHQVLMHIAFGDHQVTNVAAEVEARTIGARVHTPAITDGRNPDVTPYWGITPIGDYPYRGSAFVVWDSGSPAPPTTNLPPVGPQYGRDPHSDPRNSALAREQKAVFLTTGTVVDVCAGAPCKAG